ncbi:NADH-quinone oxidoreductase subunit NuoE [soil metagenome]
MTETITPLFSEEEMKTVNMHIAKYPNKMAAIMPVLWMLQDKYGWLSEDCMKYTGDLLSLPYEHVLGVASFYTMYFKKPMGKYHLQICTNVSCMLCGGDKLFNYVSDKLAIKNNQVTSDGIFSIEEVECLGSCGTAPMLQVNNKEFYENLTLEQVDKMIDDFRTKAGSSK